MIVADVLPLAKSADSNVHTVGHFNSFSLTVTTLAYSQTVLQTISSMFQKMAQKDFWHVRHSSS